MRATGYAKYIEPRQFTVRADGKVYVPAKNPRFPKLAAALPAVLEAIDAHWNAARTEPELSDDTFAATAAVVNKLAEHCVREYAADAKCPNRFESMKQIMQPNSPWDIWSGFGDGIAIGATRPGYFVEMAMMEDDAT